MTGDIHIYGGIGTERGEVSFENVRAQVEGIKSSDEIALHIMSPGGDVFEGEAIYNLLRNTGKKITTYIEGTCASIATLISAAGDRVIMNKTGRFMIHNPKISGLTASADARDLRHVANQLDKIKTLLIDVYDRKTTIGKQKLWELYDNETWLTADEAKAMGFVDESVDAIKAVATVNLKKFQMKEKEQGMMARIVALFKSPKFRNEFTETLADGRIIIVMSDTEDWTGKQVIFDDGSELPAGEYPMADGKILTVGEGSVITTVSDPAPQDNSNEQEMKEIEALKAQLAEALAAKDAAEAAQKQTAETAKADSIKFENRLNSLEKVLAKASETVGDKTPPKVAPGLKAVNKSEERDPMGDDAYKFYRNRNIIQDHEAE